jgi:hypothetical protein
MLPSFWIVPAFRDNEIQLCGRECRTNIKMPDWGPEVPCQPKNAAPPGKSFNGIWKECHAHLNHSVAWGYAVGRPLPIFSGNGSSLRGAKISKLIFPLPSGGRWLMNVKIAVNEVRQQRGRLQNILKNAESEMAKDWSEQHFDRWQQVVEVLIRLLQKSYHRLLPWLRTCREVVRNISTVGVQVCEDL